MSGQLAMPRRWPNTAQFSRCERYRYSLGRHWSPKLGAVLFVGLNPSTADATADDPTIRRCIGFARNWGYGGLLMGNLFALRATDPHVMLAHREPVGTGNDDWLARLAHEASAVVACWGAHGGHRGRAQEVIDRGLLGDYFVLGRTAKGEPRHPLYMRADCLPIRPRDIAGKR